MAKVLVLHKKGDKNDINNYRPVSLLPVFSKGLEKIIYNRLTVFIEKHDILTESQFGFRKKRSTELALLDQKEFILRNFEEKNVVLGIFIDFTKAFDFINHELLIQKLHIYGIRGHTALLIKSYLDNRCQYVNIGGNVSNIKPIKSGVPQGSILGPLLFNIYINDIINIAPQAKFIIYADDTSIFLSTRNCNDIIPIANDVMRRLEAWSSSNNLLVNKNKTKAILFSPKNQNISLSSDIVLYSSPIEIVNTFKTLGVLFSNHMSWSQHIDYIISKLAGVIGMLYRHRLILPQSVKLLLYNTLFVSHLNYCHLIWGTTTKTNLYRIFLLQKRAIRLVCSVPHDFHTDLIFANLGIMKIHEYYKYRLAMKYKQEYTESKSFLFDLASLRKKPQTHTLRHPDPWIIDTSRTDYGLQMIRRTLPSLLNTFSHSNVDIVSLTPREIREYFL